MIRELTSANACAYVVVRRAALLEAPLAFASSPQDDSASSPEAVCEQLRRAPISTIFGAFQPDLIGTVGIYRDLHSKSSHKAHVWGMYVAPDFRRQGIGLELLGAILRHARELDGILWIHLSVSWPHLRLSYYINVSGSKCGVPSPRLYDTMGRLLSSIIWRSASSRVLHAVSIQMAYTLPNKARQLSFVAGSQVPRNAVTRNIQPASPATRLRCSPATTARNSGRPAKSRPAGIRARIDI